jgi:hypothetical protein
VREIRFQSGRARNLLGSQYRHRGSRKRLAKIKWMGNMSLEFWIFVVTVALFLLLVVPWLILHPPAPLD